jgi:hypothetical protein
MSIIGASILGAKLGDWASELIFDYTREQYEDKIATLEGLIAKLEAHKRTLEDFKNQIPSFWEDSNAVDTAQALNLTLISVNNKMETAKGLVAVFKETAADLGGAKESMGEKLKDAIGLLEIIE